MAPNNQGQNLLQLQILHNYAPNLTSPHLTSLVSKNAKFHCKKKPYLLLESRTKLSDEKDPPYQLMHVPTTVLANFDIPQSAKEAQGKGQKCNAARCSITLPCIADRSMTAADVVAANGFVCSSTTSCRDGSAGAPHHRAPQPPPGQSYETLTCEGRRKRCVHEKGVHAIANETRTLPIFERRLRRKERTLTDMTGVAVTDCVPSPCPGIIRHSFVMQGMYMYERFICEAGYIRVFP